MQFVFTDSVDENAHISYPMDFSPDGTLLGITIRCQLCWLIPIKSPRDDVLRHMDNVFGARFSDDGKFLTTYGSDQQVIIWEMTRFHLLQNRRWSRG